MSRRITSLLLAATLLITAPALAGTITVDWAGSGDYQTIQEGLNVADGGDTVLVAPGEYLGVDNRDLDFRGVGIALVSESGPDVTIIDCGLLGRGFLFDDGEDTLTVVDGFSILNGSAEDGGGLSAELASPRIRNRVFRDCSATNAGGAVSLEGGSASFADCLFDGNHATDGGAVATLGAAPTMTGCTFIDNRAEHGGALHSRYTPSPRFSNCEFLENRSTERGCAVYLYGSSPSFSECSFLRNYGLRAGVVAGDYASPLLYFCWFASNQTTASYYGGGHAIDIYRMDIGSTTIANCTFCSWRMVGGGGRHLEFRDCAPTIERSIISFYNHGGAVECEGEWPPTFVNCLVFGNSGGDSLCGDYHQNLLVDPLFCNRWIDELALCSGSPCLPQNNPWGVLIGAFEEGCSDCETVVEAMSWGRIKALYQ
jgi:hypothetical protein